jgi:hypothetical protein
VILQNFNLFKLIHPEKRAHPAYICSKIHNTMSEEKSLNFLEEIIENDIAAGTHGGRVHTRFPTGAKWVFAYRSCYLYLSQLWARKKVQRQVQPEI